MQEIRQRLLAADVRNFLFHIADYPIPLEELQDEPAPGMPPRNALRPLDWMHGEAGRLIDDCEPWILRGGLRK